MSMMNPEIMRMMAATMGEPSAPPPDYYGRASRMPSQNFMGSPGPDMGPPLPPELSSMMDSSARPSYKRISDPRGYPLQGGHGGTNTQPRGPSNSEIQKRIALGQGSGGVTLGNMFRPGVNHQINSRNENMVYQTANGTMDSDQIMMALNYPQYAAQMGLSPRDLQDISDMMGGGMGSQYGSQGQGPWANSDWGDTRGPNR